MAAAQGLGELLGLGAQMAAKQLTTYIANHPQLTEVVARAMHEDEDPQTGWQELSNGDRALWKQRSTAALRALVNIFSASTKPTRRG